MEIIKTYTQPFSESKFIGLKYGDEDRVNGGFGEAWQLFLNENKFDHIVESAGGIEQFKALGQDGEASVSLMRVKEGEPFQYWIGMFAPPTADVPTGMESVSFPESTLGICWYLGKEPDIYGKEDKAYHSLNEAGHKCITDNEGAIWFFERYVPERFESRDEANNLILDIGFFVETTAQ